MRWFVRWFPQHPSWISLRVYSDSTSSRHLRRSWKKKEFLYNIMFRRAKHKDLLLIFYAHMRDPRFSATDVCYISSLFPQDCVLREQLLLYNVRAMGWTSELAILANWSALKFSVREMCCMSSSEKASQNELRAQTYLIIFSFFT